MGKLIKSQAFAWVKFLVGAAVFAGIAYLMWGDIALILFAFVVSVAPLVVANMSYTYIEKKIISRVKFPFRVIVGGMLSLSIFGFSLLLIYEDFQPVEFTATSEAEIVEFANSRKAFATIYTGQIYDLDIVLTSTTTSEHGMFFGGAYMPLTGMDKSDVSTYYVNVIEFDNRLAVLLTSNPLTSENTNNGLQVRKAESHIQEYYRNTMIRDIAADWDVSENHLSQLLLPVALQTVSSPDIRSRVATFGIICLAFFFVCAFVCLVMPKLRFFKMQTKFGKMLSQHEDFSSLERKINQQVKEPLLSNDSTMITRDFIIGDSDNTSGGFWYTEQLISVEFEVHEEFDDGDIQYDAFLSTGSDGFHFLTFEKDALDELKNRVDNKPENHPVSLQ